MKKEIYAVKEKVLLYPGMAGWHFISIDKQQSKEIKEKHGKHRRGFGSLPVVATIGKTSWQTSIFPTKEGPYLLPLNASVRKKEGIMHGNIVACFVKIRA